MNFFYMLAQVTVLICLHIVGCVAVIEAVNENLIHDRTLGPVRCMEAGENPEAVTRLRVSRHAQLVIVADRPSESDLEKIIERPVMHDNVNAVIIKAMPAVLPRKRKPVLLMAEENLICVVLCRAEADRNDVAGIGFHRLPVHLRLITE